VSETKINFGYYYDLRNPEQYARPPADLYAETLEFIAWTESVGFNGAWVAEHHGTGDNYIPSPLVFASAIAARTKTMRIGTSIAIAPLYHPVRFAEDCAIVDIISNGRLELGIGLGYRRSEMAGAGVDFARRGARTDESLQIVRRLWNGETVSFRSNHFTIEKARVTPRPVQDHVPIFVGGYSRRAVQRAARYADGYLGDPSCYPLYLEELRACGKDPATARFRMQEYFFYVSNDPEKTLEEIAPFALYIHNAYAQMAVDDPVSFDATQAGVGVRPMSLEAFKASGILQIFTPDQAIAYIKAKLTIAPFENFQIVGPPPGLPLSKFAEYAGLFATKVIPAFR
jgi:probable F420-dependent oxidoreductase